MFLKAAIIAGAAFVLLIGSCAGMFAVMDSRSHAAGKLGLFAGYIAIFALAVLLIASLVAIVAMIVEVVRSW